MDPSMNQRVDGNLVAGIARRAFDVFQAQGDLTFCVAGIGELDGKAALMLVIARGESELGEYLHGLARKQWREGSDRVVHRVGDRQILESTSTGSVPDVPLDDELPVGDRLRTLARAVRHYLERPGCNASSRRTAFEKLRWAVDKAAPEVKT